MPKLTQISFPLWHKNDISAHTLYVDIYSGTDPSEPGDLLGTIEKSFGDIPVTGDWSTLTITGLDIEIPGGNTLFILRTSEIDEPQDEQPQGELEADGDRVYFRIVSSSSVATHIWRWDTHLRTWAAGRGWTVTVVVGGTSYVSGTWSGTLSGILLSTKFYNIEEPFEWYRYRRAAVTMPMPFNKPINPVPGDYVEPQPSTLTRLEWDCLGSPDEYEIEVEAWDAEWETSYSSGVISTGTNKFFNLPAGALDGAVDVGWSVKAIYGVNNATSSWGFEVYQASNKAHTPSPAHEETDVELDAVLSWVFDEDFDTFKGYFGLVSGDLEYVGDTTDKTVGMPLALKYSTEYQWRIDVVDGEETTEGDVWTFTTKDPPIPEPVNPPNDAEDFAEFPPVFAWTCDDDPDEYRLYLDQEPFGGGDLTDSELTGDLKVVIHRVGPKEEFDTQTWWSSPEDFQDAFLKWPQHNTTYIWKVVAVWNIDGEQFVSESMPIVTADQWKFTTPDYDAEGIWLLGLPINPTPANENLNTNTRLAQATWENGGGATRYDVYFDTRANYLASGGTLKLASANVLDASKVLNLRSQNLVYGTAYLWRVNPKNQYFQRDGTLWEFTTLAISKYPEIIWPGAGAVEVTHRLIAIAEGKLYYEDVEGLSNGD